MRWVRRRKPSLIDPQKPTPLVELAVAYRSGDQSATLANLLTVVEHLAPFDPDGAPVGELI